jgi:hypothetical protein
MEKVGCVGQNTSHYYIACTFLAAAVTVINIIIVKRCGVHYQVYKEMVLTEIWD